MIIKYPFRITIKQNIEFNQFNIKIDNNSFSLADQIIFVTFMISQECNKQVNETL